MTPLKLAPAISHLRRYQRGDATQTNFLACALAISQLPPEQGLPVVGVSRCASRVIFALPWRLEWTPDSLETLRGIARRYFCHLEFSFHVHLRHTASGKEVAILRADPLQTLIELRPAFTHASELLADLQQIASD